MIASVRGRRDSEGWARKLFERRVEEEEEGYTDLSYPRIRYVNLPMILDDGRQRMEIRHYGHGHTTGDLVAWLPKGRILLTADLSNNGPLNLANANIASWIEVLNQLAALPVQTLVPGHGARGGPELLEMNRRFLSELRSRVGDMVERGMSYEEVLAAIEIPFHEQWSRVAVRDKPGNVKRAFLEMGGSVEASD